MGELILMRGPPGSGKSHQAKRLAGGDLSKVFSTDDWFVGQPGGYTANWHPDRLFEAHRWNQERVRTAIQAGTTPIVVDNTNLQIRYVRVYFDMACDYEVRIEESQSPWWLEIKPLLADKQSNEAEIRKWAGKLAHGFQHEGIFVRNEHNVPTDAIFGMLMKYHPFTVEDLRSDNRQS